MNTSVKLMDHEINNPVSDPKYHNDYTIGSPTQFAASTRSTNDDSIALKIENLSKIYDSGAAGK
ncbi:MAG TPA: hypothetical protein VNX68_16985, partial [Nitrosopumilaceae archaeon]|nr:hypothetical protein [Nitrosopumilaceae archaeon]